MEAEFDGPLVAATPELTYYNLGRRDAVVYLRQLRDLPEKESPRVVDPLS